MYVTQIGAALIAIAGATACSARGPRPDAWVPERRQTTVTVQNNNWLDVAVYAIEGGGRFRVGTVNGLRTATLRLPVGFAVNGTVRLLVDPIGTDATFTTPAIVVGPGQSVALMVHSRLSMSSFAVWNQ